MLAGTLAILYPTHDSPPDLSAALPRAAVMARALGHEGLLAMALSKLAFSEMDRRELRAATVHARESTALAEALHNRTMAVQSGALAEVADALAGQPAGLAAVADTVAAAWRRREIRTASDWLLKLAAGILALKGPTEAGRCLGVYQAILLSEHATTNATEQMFIDQ